MLAVGLGAHVARDLVEEPRGALLLQYPVARHELVDGGDGGRRGEVQQQEALKGRRRGGYFEIRLEFGGDKPRFARPTCIRDQENYKSQKVR